MFAIVFRFPTGRYHATPWGRNVNEADVAWPPEPWRILRALIATYWRKGDRQRWSKDDLAALIDVLAERPPVYCLPEIAVHTHTRHYMPIGEIKKGREDTTLVFDAFVRLPADAEIIAAWPEVNLPKHLHALACDLASGLGYLGRAESWVDCKVVDWDGEPNCVPNDGEQSERTFEGEPVRLIVPLSPDAYAAERQRLLAEFDEQERRKANAGSRKPLSEKNLSSAREKAFGNTLPERLLDALTLDTSDYQRFGWTRPPASREVIYFRKPLGPLPRAARSKPQGDHRLPTVARYVLAGRPRPRIEDAVKIGELMRLAALAQFGWASDESGRRRPRAPMVISGRDAEDRPLRDAEHRHAFWLPEDADGDDEIDHIVVFPRQGFDREVQQKLDQLTKLWVSQAAAIDEDSDSDSPQARQEWRLALEGFGQPSDFCDASALLRKSKRWVSVTPFLAAGHLKSGGHPAEIRRLLSRRGLPNPIQVELINGSEAQPALGDGLEGGPHSQVGRTIHRRPRRPVHFHRFRSRGRERQFDRIGTFVRLTFSEPIEGPLALGYGCHFGLGLFAAVE